VCFCLIKEVEFRSPIISTNYVFHFDLRSKYISPLNRLTPRSNCGHQRVDIQRQERASARKRIAYRLRQRSRELRLAGNVSYNGYSRNISERVACANSNAGGTFFGVRWVNQFNPNTNQSSGADLSNEGGREH